MHGFIFRYKVIEFIEEQFVLEIVYHLFHVTGIFKFESILGVVIGLGKVENSSKTAASTEGNTKETREEHQGKNLHVVLAEMP